MAKTREQLIAEYQELNVKINHIDEEKMALSNKLNELCALIELMKRRQRGEKVDIPKRGWIPYMITVQKTDDHLSLTEAMKLAQELEHSIQLKQEEFKKLDFQRREIEKLLKSL